MSGRNFRVKRCDRFVTIYMAPPNLPAGAELDADIVYRIPVNAAERDRVLKLYENRYGQSAECVSEKATPRFEGTPERIALGGVVGDNYNMGGGPEYSGQVYDEQAPIPKEVFDALPLGISREWRERLRELTPMVLLSGPPVAWAVKVRDTNTVLIFSTEECARHVAPAAGTLPVPLFALPGALQ